MGVNRQAFDTKLSLLGAAADAEVAARLQHVAVQETDGVSCYGSCAVFRIGKAPVLTAEIHH